MLSLNILKMDLLNQSICPLHSSLILDQHMNTILERLLCSRKKHQLMSKSQKLQRMETLLSRRWASKLLLMKVIWFKQASSRTLFITKVKTCATLRMKPIAKILSTMSHMENGLVKDNNSNLLSKSIQYQEKLLLLQEPKLHHFNQLLVKPSNLPKKLPKLNQEPVQNSQLVW
jgi:hypothetical protein